MTEVGQTLKDRWRSGQHVGSAKPVQRMEIQRGQWHRHYAQFVMLNGDEPDFGEIVGGKHNSIPWHPFWAAEGPWVEVPGISSVQFGDTLDTSTGMAEPTTATITIENVAEVEAAGVAGVFRRFERGHYAPWRGFQSFGRPHDDDATQNEWFDLFTGGVKVRIFQGYGDETEPVFVGLIDDCDTHSKPDQITVTTRSFGIMLTDQRLFGWNKARDVRPPVTFADRNQAFNTSKAGGNAIASSHKTGHPASEVLKVGDDTYWLSQGHTVKTVTEWVEIHLPKGKYEEFYIHPMYDGMEMFLGIYGRTKGLAAGVSVLVDGEPVPSGWIDTGLGDVPGEHGGWPYVKHWGKVSDTGYRRKIGLTLECGDNTVLRIGFRNLGHSPSQNDYRAKVSRLVAYRQKPKKLAGKAKWIAVDDAADVVRWVLMWAGFKEWNVVNLGVKLKKPITFHQTDYLIDVIAHMASEANWVFFIDQPSDDPDSIGVPTFVPNAALAPPPGSMEQVTDADLLTGVETKFTKEPLAQIIRVRGQLQKRKKGGTQLGEDHANRVTGVYTPPWSGIHHDILSGEPSQDYPFGGRLSGLLKHETHFDPNVETADEALMGCLLIATQMALASFGATIEVPGYPGFSLNEQVSVVDTPSGTNSRLWITGVNSTFTTGENAEWKTTLEGVLVDTPDLLLIAFDYLALFKRIQNEYGI